MLDTSTLSDGAKKSPISIEEENIVEVGSILDLLEEPAQHNNEHICGEGMQVY